MDWFSFYAGETVFGIQTEYVFRVVETLELAPALGMPACYLGVSYYRGELYDIVDLVKLMDPGNNDSRHSKRIVLIKWEDKKIGLQVDTIVGLSWVDPGTAEDHRQDVSSEIQYLTPETIWRKLLEESYGPDQIS